MDEKTIDALLDSDLRKLTGSIEHWLTAYQRGYWGLEGKYEDEWKEEIHPGDVFVLHGSGSKYLNNVSTTEVNKVDTGIIGVAIVDSKNRKEHPVWLAEKQGNGEWPLLIQFSEIYWFGNTDEIEDVEVENKTDRQMLKEIKHLAENIIDFDEMRDRTGYRIPAQHSFQNIAQQEKLVPLLRERLEQLDNSKAKDPESTDGVEDKYVPDQREEEYTVSKRKKRSGSFAPLVKKKYDYKCAVCGAMRFTPDENPEVEAAHIKPVSDGGPDHITNGIALCRLHHWAYDNGWIQIEEDYRINVNEEKGRKEYEEFEHLDGEKLRLPENDEIKPKKKFIKG